VTTLIGWSRTQTPYSWPKSSTPSQDQPNTNPQKQVPDPTGLFGLVRKFIGSFVVAIVLPGGYDTFYGVPETDKLVLYSTGLAKDPETSLTKPMCTHNLAFVMRSVHFVDFQSCNVRAGVD
jgi:hypothetical protein